MTTTTTAICLTTAPESSRHSTCPVARLVLDARGGDQAAWEAIVDRFSALVWATVRGYRLSHADAIDASQTTWLRLVEHIDRIREPEHLGGWLTTTARREALRLIRQSARELATDAADLLETPDSETPDERILESERTETIRHAFVSLPVRSRRLLQLLFSEAEPAYTEIAATLGIPVGAIGPTRMRCLQRLRRNPSLSQLVL
jgi:RNA polymerase sigma factor (sigma-70 family)